MIPQRAARIFAVVVTLTMVAVEVPIFHHHREAGPAWYDEECPFVRLAVSGSAPGVPPVVDLVQPVPAADAVVPATPTGALRVSFLPISARAPPIAS